MQRIAEKLAKKVKSRRQRHSCIILKGGRIISQANNEKGHAEQLALGCTVFDKRNLEDDYSIDMWADREKFKGATLISFRAKPDGTIGNSKPCDKCEFAIKIHKIRKVIYFNGLHWVEEYR